jgi:hypothetical protein
MPSSPVPAGGPFGSLAEAALHARRPFMPDLVQVSAVSS